MSIELRIPSVGESVQEVQVGKWLKREGDRVELDEEIVELETDKASVELPSPATGVLVEILKKQGATVAVGDVIARIDESNGEVDGGKASGERDEASAKEGGEPVELQEGGRTKRRGNRPKRPTGESAERDAKRRRRPTQQKVDKTRTETKGAEDEARATHGPIESGADEERDEPARSAPATSPSARRALRQHGLTVADVKPSAGRLRREDVERHVRETTADQTPEESPRPTARTQDAASAAAERPESELEEVVPMSLIRRRIAERLVAAQQHAALLTTFNECDMSAVIELRRRYRERFQREFEVDLGYMPFFVKAVIDGLRNFPVFNAEIRGTDMIYRNYYHIGIAVGGDKGLVVPVLRFAELLSFAEIQEAIGDFARRAESNRLEPDELVDGTFTITNGGVYGSLLSTPLVNPPQSGVLGMHAIEDRPVARDGQVVIRPMMYAAVTYDHRIADGRDAVLFLRRIKEAIEDPARMLLEV